MPNSKSRAKMKSKAAANAPVTHTSSQSSADPGWVKPISPGSTLYEVGGQSLKGYAGMLIPADALSQALWSPQLNYTWRLWRHRFLLRKAQGYVAQATGDRPATDWHIKKWNLAMEQILVQEAVKAGMRGPQRENTPCRTSARSAKHG